MGAVAYTLAVLAGTRLPLITSGRAAFYVLAAISFAIFSIGMGKLTTGLGWSHPISTGRKFVKCKTSEHVKYMAD